MAKTWSYTSTPHQVGLMICTACRQPITDGEYRFRETEDAYLPQHRSCCQSDPNWLRLDREEQKRLDYHRRRQADFDAFVKEWGMPYDLMDE